MKITIYKTQTNTVNTKQSGLSLIELLIAMFIGLFLLAGITTSYLSSKKTSIARDQLSILEDNGRLALEVLVNTLQHTGYATGNIVALDEDKLITTAVASSSCRDGTPSVINTALFSGVVTDDNNSGDRIGAVYLGDDNIFTDCSGGTLPASCQISPNSGSSADPAKIYSAFFLDGSNNLQCAGSRDGALQTIAEGIENMQILYGVANDDNQIVRYVNAADVGDLWDNVINIQIAILARSLREVKDTAEQQKFTLLDYEHTTPTDRFQRAVFSTTISLRNALN